MERAIRTLLVLAGLGLVQPCQPNAVEKETGTYFAETPDPPKPPFPPPPPERA